MEYDFVRILGAWEGIVVSVIFLQSTWCVIRKPAQIDIQRSYLQSILILL